MKQGHENKAVISVLGADRPGIVAKLSNCLAQAQCNILEMSQTIVDGIFTMTLIVQLHEHKDFSELKDQLELLAQELQVQIQFQRYEIFDYMYRV